MSKLPSPKDDQFFAEQELLDGLFPPTDVGDFLNHLKDLRPGLMYLVNGEYLIPEALVASPFMRKLIQQGASVEQIKTDMPLLYGT